MNFLWGKDNITFEGQTDPDALETEIRLRIINESLGKILTIECFNL